MKSMVDERQNETRATRTVRRNFFGEAATMIVRASFAAALAVLVTILPGSAMQQSATSTRAATDTLRIDLHGARELALRANPELSAARLDIDIAAGDYRQASVWMQANPELGYLGGSPASELEFGQEVEIAGQRGARRAAARAGVERAREGVMDVARLTLGDVDRAFFRLVVAERLSEVAAEVLALNQRLADVARRQMESGEISGLEMNLAVLELGRAQARSLSAAREQIETASELKEVLGIPPSTPIFALPPSTDDSVAIDVDSLTAIALARRPDFTEQAAAVRQAGAEVSVSRREAWPDVLLRAESEEVEGLQSRESRLGLGFTLPLFNRNQGEIDARRAEERQAQLELSAVAARIRLQVARAAASYEAARREREVLAVTVLTPARENRQLLEIAFREGKVGIAELLLIQNQVIDAEMEYWEAWLIEREALTALTEATAETLTTYVPSGAR